MNGIKRSLLLCCLLLLVGSSIQQPLHTGRPGEKLKNIVALIRNNKETLLVVGGALVGLMLKMNLFKHLWNDEFIRMMVTLQISNYPFRELKLWLRDACFYVVYDVFYKEVLNSRTFFLKKNTSNFYKTMLNVSDRIRVKVTRLIIVASLLMFIRGILKKHLKDLPQELKFRIFPDADIKEQCPICLVEKAVSELVNPCKERKHLYCKECIMKWYEDNEIVHKTCPTCRRQLMEVDNKSIHEKFMFIFKRIQQFIPSKKGRYFCGAFCFFGIVLGVEGRSLDLLYKFLHERRERIFQKIVSNQ